jgi:hypothetical protein
VYEAACCLTLMDPAFASVTNLTMEKVDKVVRDDTPELQRKRENFRAMCLRQNMFGQGWTKMDEALLGELLDMRPTVPYAQANAQLYYRNPKPDKYLTDQDLVDYLAKTPVSNP